jgi:thiazole synthase
MLRDKKLKILPNTAGCHSVKEAVSTAHMAREIFDTNWIKLEVIGHNYNLQPDPVGLIEAARILHEDGFMVFPYMTDDLWLADKLANIGLKILMPWASPIGSGRGLQTVYNLQIIREHFPGLHLIIDAGIGRPSDACKAMELGYDAVLLNTAVARATYPISMAKAFALAIDSGRAAFCSGIMEKRLSAQPSTIDIGKPFWHQSSYAPSSN